MNDRTCGGCRFWYQSEPTDQNGQCRRHPPMAVMPHGLVRPTMAEDNSCGEWRDKSITPEQEHRAELVTRIALAIVESGDDIMMHDVWQMAAEYVDAKPKIGGES